MGARGSRKVGSIYGVDLACAITNSPSIEPAFSAMALMKQGQSGAWYTRALVHGPSMEIFIHFFVLPSIVIEIAVGTPLNGPSRPNFRWRVPADLPDPVCIPSLPASAALSRICAPCNPPQPASAMCRPREPDRLQLSAQPFPSECSGDVATSRGGQVRVIAGLDIKEIVELALLLIANGRAVGISGRRVRHRRRRDSGAGVL
ncbi:hypothetical protein ACVWWP_008639 [Bradyrhizobium sp. LM3.6]